MRGASTAHDCIVPFDVLPDSTRLGAPADNDIEALKQKARRQEEEAAFAKYDQQKARKQEEEMSITSYCDVRGHNATGRGVRMSMPGQQDANRRYVQAGIRSRQEHDAHLRSRR